MKTIKFKVTLVEEMLGSKPSSSEVFTDYIASKKKDATPKDEIDAAKAAEEEIEMLEKGMTVFHRAEDGKTPIMWDYEWKGFFKDSIKALRRDPETESAKLKAYKSVIDGNVFVFDRKITLNLPKDGKIGICERPLRAQTMQGERVALAKSETVPAGTTMEIKVMLLNKEYEAVILECMEYGALRGLGQWRSSGKGRFTFERIGDEETSKVKKGKK